MGTGYWGEDYPFLWRSETDLDQKSQESRDCSGSYELAKMDQKYGVKMPYTGCDVSAGPAESSPTPTSPTTSEPPPPPPWPEGYVFSTDPDRIICRYCCKRHYNYKWYSHCYLCLTNENKSWDIIITNGTVIVICAIRTRTSLRK
jgi:hypothetical protein